MSTPNVAERFGPSMQSSRFVSIRQLSTMLSFVIPLSLAAGCAATGSSTASNLDPSAQTAAPTGEENTPIVQLQAGPKYVVQPGDVLQISVWKEPDLQREAVVRPDGLFSMPLVGDVQAAGHSVAQIRADLAKKLATYIPDANVHVAILQLNGNKIYVVGKVNRPGEFAVARDVDVMQALTMAGGTARFAALDEIIVLRRHGAVATAIPFDYSDVEQGRRLEQNIVLQAGDVVVVP
jgi:polysaccharide export outer membrane protein